MVNIALDATPLTTLTGGVSRYTSELALSLAAEYESDDFWLLSDQPFHQPLTKARNLHFGNGARSVLERRWWLWGLQSEISRLQIDVFHGTDFAVPYVPVRPSVLSLHDLSPWLDAAWHSAADRVRTRTPVLLRLGLATLVLTPSEAIRREAMARFRLQPDRIVSVPHGASEIFRPVEPKRCAPYFLFVGTLEPRKNLGLLLGAWRAVRERHPVDLVLIGRRREDFPNLSPEPGLHLCGPLPDAQLPAFYSGCLACVYPSLYEGFGLPVLEAMQCGAPVVTSRDPAIVETAGNAAIALDVNEPALWAEALTAICEDATLRGNLRERSLRRAASFSWGKTARQTREVYDEAAKRFRRKT